MKLSSNPTKTRGIEKAWLKEINTRWRAFSKAVTGELKRGNSITVNAFEFDAVQLRAYIAYFDKQIDLLLVGSWQEKYIRRSYELAIDRAMQQLRLSGARSEITRLDRALADKIDTFTSTSVLGITAADVAILPIHQEALEFLFTRSFESLDGFTSQMASQVRNILFDGVRQGKGIAEITREIKNRISVSRSRARLIAQTETIQSYQRGTINQAILASERLGEPVDLRWSTRRDSKVRPLHVGFHGDIMTIKQAQRNISLSPYRCRCALLMVIKETNTPADRAKFAAEKAELTNLTI